MIYILKPSRPSPAWVTVPNLVAVGRRTCSINQYTFLTNMDSMADECMDLILLTNAVVTTMNRRRFDARSTATLHGHT